MGVRNNKKKVADKGHRFMGLRTWDRGIENRRGNTESTQGMSEEFGVYPIEQGEPQSEE